MVPRTRTPTITTTEVPELLHAGALGASALGACCVALDGPRPRVRELALMAVMVLAMIDVVGGTAVIPTVCWSGLIGIAAILLAVRRRSQTERDAVSRMRLHSALAAIVMAALMLIMSVGHGGGDGGHHSLSPATMTVAVVAAALIVSCSAGWHARRGHPLERLQYAMMAASLLMLGGAALA